MDILIIAQYMGDIVEPDNSNSRFMYLYKLLERNDNVEIVTSDFIHNTKQHVQHDAINSEETNITLLHEAGYSKNVSLKRFISHRGLSRNLKLYLNERKKPDVIYCAVPSLDVAYIASKYCIKEGIKYIIDIQDLWPEAFKMVFHVPLISNFLFKPMENRANKIYHRADKVVAVSQTYADRAMLYNEKCDASTVVYLGTDKRKFDEYSRNEPTYLPDSLKVKNKIWIAYCGTLGSSYDLPVVFNALKLFNDEQLKKVLLIIMGDGPQKQNFVEISDGVPVIFTGMLPYSDMVWILSRCDIAVNPIVKGAAQSLINKQMDYAMAALPVVNTQECEEYKNLLEEYNAGINCSCGSEKEVSDALIKLIYDPELSQSMGQNNRLMGEEKFDRKLTYFNLVRCIQND